MNANAIAEIVSMPESIYLLSQLDSNHQFAYGKLMRLHDPRVTDCGRSWQELDLTGQPAITDIRVVRDVKFLEECNLILVSSVEGTGHRINRLIFDFYSADTFEPHPDAARPSVILNCPESLQLIVEGGDLLSNGVATVTLSGDFVLFKVVNWTSERTVDGRSRVKDHLFYCVLWREGLLLPVGTQSSWAACIELQFIAHKTILITHAEKPHMELCTLAKCPERGWVLQTALCLELPQFAPRVTLSTCSGILTDDTGTIGLVAQPVNSPPLFSTSMSTSMCILSITLERSARRALFFRSFILVMRCASLLKLFMEVPPEERTTWSQPAESYLYMDGEIPGPDPTHSGGPPIITARSLPRTMKAERWSKEGVLWIDGGELDETLGQYCWSVNGQHILAWAEEFEYSGPALPLRVFHFNEHDIERALSLVRSISVQPENVTRTKVPSSNSTGHEDPDADAEPPNSFFGKWTDISNGKKIAVVEHSSKTPAGIWWSHDLVSNLPFAITQTTQAERWPMTNIRGDLIMRKQQSQAVDGTGHEANSEAGTCFEVFRIGSGWTVE